MSSPHWMLNASLGPSRKCNLSPQHPAQPCCHESHELVQKCFAEICVQLPAQAESPLDYLCHTSPKGDNMLF